MCDKALFTQFSAKTNEICVNMPILHIFYEIPGQAGNDGKGKHGTA